MAKKKYEKARKRLRRLIGGGVEKKETKDGAQEGEKLECISPFTTTSLILPIPSCIQ